MSHDPFDQARAFLLLFMLMLDKDWPPVGAVRDFFQMQVAAIKGLTVW